MKSGPTHLWVFTEHRSATFIINFELPLQHSSGQTNVQFDSWSSEEITKLGFDAMAAILRHKAKGTFPDVAIFSRYVLPHGQALMTLCKSLGIVTLFHLDDLLQELPQDIGHKYTAVYSDAYQAKLDDCICAANGVLASTPILATQISKRYPLQSLRTVLGVCYRPVPSWTTHGIRSRVARLKRGVASIGFQTIGYMGSSSHLRDLATITPQIVELMRARPNLRFETLGLPAPVVLKAQFGDRIRQFGFTSTYSEFLASLYELRWDLGLAPLVRDDFNQAKTATKFIEYTASGTPTLAEALGPYAPLGLEHHALALATGDEWVKAITYLLSNDSIRRRQLRRAQTLCNTMFTGSFALEQLLSAIEHFSTIRNQTRGKI